MHADNEELPKSMVHAERVIEEVEAAIKVREKYRVGPKRAEEKLAGPYHKDAHEGAEGTSDVENRIHELVATTMPRLAMHNPRVRMGTDRVGPAQESAMALRHGINRWVEDTAVKHEAQLVARDMLTGYGISHVGLEDAPLSADSEIKDPVRPIFERICPDDHIMDPWCHHWTKARFHSHRIVTPQEQLLQHAKENPDEGWNIKAIERMAIDTYTSEGGDGYDTDKPARGEVVYWQVWMRNDEEGDDLTPEDRETLHGRLYYVCLEKDQKPDGKHSKNVDWIRDPQPYYGPEQGPYQIYGVWDAPETPFPISPAVAIMEGVEYFNRIKLANMSAESDHKRLLIVDDSMEELPEIVKDGEDGLVVRAQGFNKDKIAAVEIGGATPQGYLAEDRQRTWLDRMSGTDPGQAGSAQANTTATATVVADESAETLRAHMKSRFNGSMEQAMLAVAWYLYYEEDIEFALGGDASKDTGYERPTFQGGPTEGLSFQDLELRLEVMSMEQTSAGLHQARMEKFFTWLVTVAPALIQFPFLKSADIIRQYAESLNLWDMDDLVDDNLLRMMTAAAAESAVMAAEGQAQQDQQGQQGQAQPQPGGGSSAGMLQAESQAMAGEQRAAVGSGEAPALSF